MKKKIFSVVLSITILFSFMVVSGNTAYALDSSGTCGTSVKYTFDSSTGELFITGRGDMANYTYSGSPFYYQALIKSVVFDSYVTSVGENAFVACPNLKSVKFGKGIKSIGEQSFYNCEKLNSLQIPDNVNNIGRFAFEGCKGLESIEFGKGLTNIGKYAFRYAVSLYNITVSPYNEIFDSRDGCNAVVETATNKIVLGCKKTTFPNSVDTIGEYSFAGCDGLLSINIPNSIKCIEMWAFNECLKLENVTLSKNIETINSYAFANCLNLKEVNYLGKEEQWNSVLKGSGAFPTNTIINYHSNCEFSVVENVEPTCTEIGSCLYRCICGDSYNEIKSVLGHDIVGVSSIENSSIIYSCSRCLGESKNIIDINNFWNKDDVNKVAKSNPYLDLNNDNFINAKDYAILNHI